MSKGGNNDELFFDHGVSVDQRIVQIVPDNGDYKDSCQYHISMADFARLDVALSILEKKSKEPITIRICSIGGDTGAALAMLGRIKSSPCHIITEGYGVVESAATILLACGDRRRISKYASFMHHEASYGADGRHSEIKHKVKRIETEERLWCEHMATFTKKDAAFYLKHGVGKDAYWTPEELLEFGIVDEVF